MFLLKTKQSPLKKSIYKINLLWEKNDAQISGFSVAKKAPSP